MRRAAALLLFALLPAACTTARGAVPAPAAPVPAEPVAATPAAALRGLPLLVVGNRVVGPDGATVVLRGLHRDGTQGGPDTSAAQVTAAEIGWMGHAHPGSWHATVVRVPVGAAQWTGLCPRLAGDPAGYRAAVDREVRTVTAAGMVALLELHTSTAGCTSVGRHAMPDAEVSTAFWQDAAAHFRDDQRVAFELYNEPHYVPDDIWLNGTTGASLQDCDLTPPYLQDAGRRRAQQAELARCRRTAPRYRAVGMQALYDTVSRRAPGHLVVVDGPGYAATAPQLRVRASLGQLVYALHPYACSHPGEACDTTARAHADLALLRSWQPLARTAPVLVTEMGWPAYARGYGAGYTDGAAYYRETIAFLEQQSPRWGWVAFAFDGS
ncbi:MAG: glycoside hydrolase family 5 protein, partial [Mycobacteriales bacterium]